MRDTERHSVAHSESGLTWTTDSQKRAEASGLLDGRRYSATVYATPVGWQARVDLWRGQQMYTAYNGGFDSPALAQAWAAASLIALRGVAERLA